MKQQTIDISRMYEKIIIK